MPSRHAFLLTLATLLGATGCKPALSDVSGNWTRGERGITRWQINDGLCPGVGGGCAFDVPIAVGATVTLQVDGVESVPITAELTGGIEADGPPRIYESSDTIIPIRVVGPGAGRVALSDESGFLDAASVEGRVPTRLECGRYEIGQPITWRLPALEVGDELTLPLPTEEGASSGYWLACLASDAEGPMLSADAIRWTIVSGSESLRIATTGLIVFPGSSGIGARVSTYPRAAGDVVVRAELGGLSRELTVHVVE